MSIYSLATSKKRNEARLTRKELPYTIGMIVLDIAAPICLMFGLKSATPANASLLNNFEIVATTVIALLLFKEKISKKMWFAIILITISSIILSFEGIESFKFSVGSLFIILACICWGLENNCTKKLSSKSVSQIVVLKGIFSGLGSFIVAIIAQEKFPEFIYIFYALVLGFVSYGLSIFFYVKAQKELGAAKTSAYYSVNPFIGSILSFVIFQEALSTNYVIALLIMIVGTSFVVSDTLKIKNK